MICSSSVRLTKLAAALGLALGLAGAHASAPLSPDTTRVIVTFKPGSAAAAAARSAIASLGGRVKLEIIDSDSVAVELPKKALAALKRNAAVALVEDDALRYPMALTRPTPKPYKSGQLLPYGIEMVEANKLPEADRYTGNRTLCIIDSGVDATHEDLHNNNYTGEYDEGTGWWYTDETHHGTHVAGTISARNQKDRGVVGINPNGRLHVHFVKVFGADGEFTYSSTLANAAKKCQAAGANVISMSLGGGLPTSTERKTFDDLKDAGILSIAAAGNGGTSGSSYPAAYSSVVSVAAIDEFKVKAAFSQFNKDVELAGPGVGVLSSVPMGTGTSSDLTVGGTSYASTGMDGSPQVTATGPLADFGLGDAVTSTMTGKICLIARGIIDFGTKVSNCQASGGVGAIVYNNVPGTFAGTLGEAVTTIPSVSTSDTDGAAMLTQLGQSTTVAIEASNYAYFDGTSMATPHVSGVAALVWSYFPECTGEQIRDALDQSAEDLGDPGRDVNYGYGLVSAKAAYHYLKDKGGCPAN